MPIISTFFGIVIRMFYEDHPPPHFHAEHQGQQGTFGFDGVMIAGSIRSRTALRLIPRPLPARGFSFRPAPST